MVSTMCINGMGGGTSYSWGGSVIAIVDTANNIIGGPLYATGITFSFSSLSVKAILSGGLYGTFNVSVIKLA